MQSSTRSAEGSGITRASIKKDASKRKDTSPVLSPGGGVSWKSIWLRGWSWAKDKKKGTAVRSNDARREKKGPERRRPTGGGQKKGEHRLQSAPKLQLGRANSSGLAGREGGCSLQLLLGKAPGPTEQSPGDKKEFDLRGAVQGGAEKAFLLLGRCDYIAPNSEQGGTRSKRSPFYTQILPKQNGDQESKKKHAILGSPPLRK